MVVGVTSPLHQLQGSECDRLVPPIKKSDNQLMLIKRWPIILVLLVLVAGTAYLINLGSTEKWPETDCTFAGSRVLKDVVPPEPGRSHVIVLYKGEYRLRYTVRGIDYFTWVSSGWADPEKQFVEAKMDPLPEYCAFRIRYNPARPSEAVVVSKVRPGT